MIKILSRSNKVFLGIQTPSVVLLETEMQKDCSNVLVQIMEIAVSKSLLVPFFYLESEGELSYDNFVIVDLRHF